jgi:hypothetical protein
MTSEGINRAPAGIPSGGQFVANNHAEAPIKLFDRTDGSFLRPAPSATAEHCIQFWSNVEIPDEIITQVESEYNKTVVAEINEDMDSAMGQWRERWVTANPAPRGGRQLEEHQARYKADFEEYRTSILPGVESRRPKWLGEYDSRQLIRAAQMRIHRPHGGRFPQECQRVLDEPIELFDEVLTVQQVEEKYRLSQMRYAMEKVFHNDAEALLRAVESQSEQLSGIHEQLVHQRADFSQY